MLKSIKHSWTDFPNELSDLIKELPRNSTIIEIGGGANPTLSPKNVIGLNYIVLDIDKDELEKAKGDYFQKICADITKDNLEIKCDLVFSKMLLEHIQEPEKFHKSCYKMLNSNGMALHFFATKYSPASIVNMILPEHISKQILYKIQKRRWETEGKFPAFYRWSTGPTAVQINRYESIGFEVVKYVGYIGARYLSNMKYLQYIEIAWNKLLFAIHSPWFCSNAIVLLRKK